jgi:hypothetical protein
VPVNMKIGLEETSSTEGYVNGDGIHAVYFSRMLSNVLNSHVS